MAKPGTIDLDSILVELGQFGRFQARNYFFILFTIIFSAVYTSQYIFNAAAVPYRCKVPECESSPPMFKPGEWGEWALPAGGGRCERYRPVATTCAKESFNHSETQTCDAWVYEHHNSIFSEFDLACDEWKRTLVGTMHSAGLFVALPLTAYISDTFGRRLALLLTAVMPAVVGLARSFSTNYPTYIVLEFLDACVGAGVYSSSFILALEMVGLEKRVMGGNLISCTFALGQAIVAVVAWAVPQWRSLTRIIYAPSFIFLTYHFLIEESVRWLLSKGRNQEAAKIIFRVAEINKKKLSPESIKNLTAQEPAYETNSQEDAPVKNSVMLEVMKSKVLVTRVFICSFWWMTVTFIYYGLSINSVSLAGNSYLNYIFTSLVEIPGYLLSMVTLNRFGRKTSIMTAFYICGLALVSLPFIPDTLLWLQTSLSMLGKMCISMAFSSVYIYTSELFPTTLRHSLVAACSVCGRVGHLIAPQTPLLMEYMRSLPYLLFGVMAFTSGLLMFLTPETLSMRLPDTVQQAEDIAAGPAQARATDIIVE